MPPQETLQHQQVGLVVSCGVMAPFPWVLVHVRFCLQDWSLYFPQSFWSPAIKSCWPSKSYSLGSLVPLLNPQAGMPHVECRTFTTVGELLWYYYSPVCGSPTLQIWDLILSWLCPSYHLTEASSLSLNVKYLFLVGSSILLSMVVQKLIVILMLLKEEKSARPLLFHLNWSFIPSF